MGINFSILLSGMLFVIAVIAGIGPQSLNILSHGVRRNYAFTVAIVCFLADIVLILGAGYGLAQANLSWLILLINVLGLIFVIWYTYTKIKSLVASHDIDIDIDNTQLSYRQSVLNALMVTILNPLVFIDTVVIIGGNSLHYTGMDHHSFMLGAVCGDFIWVFGLTILGLVFTRKLNNKYFWIIMDLITILIMLVIVYRIINYLIGYL